MKVDIPIKVGNEGDAMLLLSLARRCPGCKHIVIRHYVPYEGRCLSLSEVMDNSRCSVDDCLCEDGEIPADEVFHARARWRFYSEYMWAIAQFHGDRRRAETKKRERARRQEVWQARTDAGRRPGGSGGFGLPPDGWMDALRSADGVSDPSADP